MINKLSLIAEIMTTIIFLYGLYGEKFRIDYKEVILIATDLIIMECIDCGYLPHWASAVIFLIIMAYCIWRFGWNGKKLLVNSVLHIVFLGGLQMLCFFCVFSFMGNGAEEVRSLLTNMMMLLICMFLSKTKKPEQISYYFQRNDIIIQIILISVVGIVMLCMYGKKENNGLYLGGYVLIAGTVLIISVLAISWQSYKLKAKERDMELKAYKLYEESYKNLISDIRLKQHEFNNHINAVYSQHLTCKTYEGLVERQKMYCENILYDNRYEKLLRAGNSMLIGFLYGKFLEAERRNIHVEYEINCGELKTALPMHKLVELTGNLLNNAMDALEGKSDKCMYISITEKSEYINIEVRNVYESLSVEQINQFFKKGYSSKGDNRGLGLYGLKKLGKEYGFEIICSNVMHENKNWISFCVQLKRTA